MGQFIWYDNTEYAAVSIQYTSVSEENNLSHLSSSESRR